MKMFYNLGTIRNTESLNISILSYTFSAIVLQAVVICNHGPIIMSGVGVVCKGF